MTTVPDLLTKAGEKATAPFEERTVTRVDAPQKGKDGEIRQGVTCDGLGFGVKLNGHDPIKVGEKVRLYGVGFTNYGVDVWRDGQWVEIDFRTESDRRFEGQLWSARNRLKTLEAYRKAKDKLDEIFNGLPDVFQQRILRFRKHNPDFRWEYESYELVVCQTAVEIAVWAKKQNLDAPLLAVREFHENLSIEQQYKIIEDRGHSGNQMGIAVRLACHYVGETPALVTFEHGAMAPLVGCDKYGCPPPDESELPPELRP